LIAEIFLAFMGAVFFALSTISIRKGFDESNFVSVTLVTTIIGVIIFWILVLIIFPLKTINLNGILLFVLSGALAPGFSRLVYFRGMKELGASINSSIVAAYPIVSSLIAVFLLDEHPTLVVWIGIFIAISGITMIERSTIHGGDAAKKVTSVSFVYPFANICFVGSGLVVRKMALNVYSEPVIGVAIGYSVSLFIYLFLWILSRDFRVTTEVSKRTFHLFWKGGLCTCFGMLCSNYALKYGDVSIAVPILNTETIFVLLFAHLFLKKLEKVSSLLLIGAVMVVFGILFITVF